MQYNTNKADPLDFLTTSSTPPYPPKKKKEFENNFASIVIVHYGPK